MSVRLYMDVHVKQAVTDGLTQRGVDVVTAQDEGAHTWDDVALLDRATELGRVLVTQDVDFLREARHRQSLDLSFAGVVFSPQRNVSVGQLVHDLELIAKVYEPEDIANRVEHLPL